MDEPALLRKDLRSRLARHGQTADPLGGLAAAVLEGVELHLIKLCVGIDSIEELERHIARRAARGEIVHTTRQTPRQADALLDGGSLYWVIKGMIQARQPILDLRAETDTEGRSLCAIVLAPELIPVQPRPRRPFQGWRYLKPEDAPPDLATGGGDDIPLAMRAALAELALI